MSVKLTNQVIEDISVFEMKDGQIAVITNWGYIPEYVGRIVQRYGNNLIAIGMECVKAWPGFFNEEPDSRFRVRLLQPGETITIAEN